MMDHYYMFLIVELVAVELVGMKLMVAVELDVTGFDSLTITFFLEKSLLTDFIAYK